MGAPQNLRAVGDQIEQLLDELKATADPRSFDRAAELLRLVSELYGGGLARVMEIVAERDRALVGLLAADDLVASLLVVHGLHPDAVDRRVEDALTRVRPILASHGGDVELLEIDPGTGSVRLRLLGTCDGCPSSSVTLQTAVERAITEAAPEIVRIDVEEPSRAQGAPVAFGPKPTNSGSNSEAGDVKPAFGECPAEMVAI